MNVRVKLAAILTCVIVLPLTVSADEKLIRADGSSTVYPISEAMAEEFGATARDVNITVGVSGTGGGFKKFCNGETVVSGASRPIKASEQEACKAKGIEYVELPIAYDALTVVVNPKNTWVDTLTVEDLKKIWAPEAQEQVKTWKDVRPEWPAKPLKLFGPGVDSGTFDYFTETIVGKEKASRGDYTSSEDDNITVKGVSQEEGALGYMGFAYYEENKGKLKAVKIDGQKGQGAQVPSIENVVKGLYRPLSRPLFWYVRADALDQKHIADFANFAFTHTGELIKDVGYIPLEESVQKLSLERLKKRTTGTVMSGLSSGKTLEQVLSGS